MFNDNGTISLDFLGRFWNITSHPTSHSLSDGIDRVFCFFGILSIPDFLKTDFLYSKQSVNTVFKKRWALSKLEKYGKF